MNVFNKALLTSAVINNLQVMFTISGLMNNAKFSNENTSPVTHGTGVHLTHKHFLLGAQENNNDQTVFIIV